MNYIKYSPMYRKMANGSLTAGIVLAHILFWASKKEEFYKTDKELSIETGLTTAEIKNAKKILKELGFIEISKRGMPAKTYYRINDQKFKEAFEETTKNIDDSQVSSAKTDQLVGVDQTNFVGKNQNNKKNRKKESLPRTKPRGYEYPKEFEELWSNYRVGDKWAGYRAWHKRLKEGYSIEQLARVVDLEQEKKSDKKYCKHLSTLLNGDIEEYLKEWDERFGEADDDIWLSDLKMTFKEAKERGLL